MSVIPVDTNQVSYCQVNNTFFCFYIFAHKPPGLITVRESPSGEI